MLDSLTADLLYKHSSFLGFTNAYNYLFKCREAYIIDTDKIKRTCLHESRLIEAWFYYQYLKTYQLINHNLIINPAPKINTLDRAIRKLKPQFVDYFTKKWTGN